MARGLVSLDRGDSGIPGWQSLKDAGRFGRAFEVCSTCAAYDEPDHNTFRKTAATLIAERVDAETAGRQLGHSSPVITRQFYISKPEVAADGARVLDELANRSEAEPPTINGE